MDLRSPASIELTLACLVSLRLQYSLESQLDDYVMRLLADLRHYCDAYGLNFAALDHRAYEHYCLEKNATVAQPAEDLRVRPPAYLSIPQQAWEDISPARNCSVLAAHVLIEGVPHSVLAVRVEDPTGTELRASRTAAGEEPPPRKQAFRTVSIYGRHYVLDITASLT